MIDWFAPGYKAGGPIQSCVNIALALKGRYEVYVLTTDTDHGETVSYPGIPSNCWRKDLYPGINIFYARKSTLSRNQLKKEIITIQADYIYLNLLFSPYFAIYPLWLKYISKIKSKIILCPRGTLYDSALAEKTYKKKSFIFFIKLTGIYKQVLFHATNRREEQAIQKYFPKSEIVIANNLPNFNQPEFVSCTKIKGSVKCIFIARIVPIKNLLYLLNILDKVKAQIELTIVGPVEDRNYWGECLERIDQLNPNIQIDYIGAKKNDELFTIIQQHHLFILPTTGENFGHSIFEALLTGRPVLISDQTPWLNLINYNAGWDISLSVPDAYVKVIEEVAERNQQEFDEKALSAWQFAKKFIENPALKQQYYNLFS